MRIFGVFLLSITAFGAAFSQAGECMTRQKLYSLCAVFWNEFTNYLEHTRASPKEIMLRLSAFSQYDALDFVRGTVALQGELPFSEAYAAALENSCVRNLEIYPLLQEAGPIPGSSNLDNQLEKLGLICRQMERTAEEQRDITRERVKLWRSMSYLSAALVFIILI